MKNNFLKLKAEIKSLLPRKMVVYIQVFLSLLRNPKYCLQSTFLFKNMSIVEIKNKVYYNIIVDPQNGFVDKYIFVYKDFEPEIKDIFLKYVKEGFTVLDIGANIGVHTLFFSKVVGDTGRVIAFEPIKRICEQLKKSIAINDFQNIVLNNYALGDKQTNAKINILKENMGGSSIYNNKDTKFDSEENIMIKVLDNLNLPRIDFIKMDVEGYEWNVIKGAKNLLERDRPNIVFEYNPISYDEEEKGSSLEFLRYLKSLGYKLFDVSEINREIEDFEMYRGSFNGYIKFQSNIVALTSIFENDKDGKFNVSMLHSGIGDIERQRIKELEYEF